FFRKAAVRPDRDVFLLVIMERPAPDLQHRGLRCESGRIAAQSRIQMGAGGEERTIYRVGCPCGDDCGGGSGSGRGSAKPWDDPESARVGASADRQIGQGLAIAGVL